MRILAIPKPRDTTGKGYMQINPLLEFYKEELTRLLTEINDYGQYNPKRKEPCGQARF